VPATVRAGAARRRARRCDDGRLAGWIALAGTLCTHYYSATDNSRVRATPSGIDGAVDRPLRLILASSS
jgi:hypothetical protein